MVHNHWLVVTGTMEWIQLGMKNHPTWLSLHHSSEEQVYHQPVNDGFWRSIQVIVMEEASQIPR